MLYVTTRNDHDAFTAHHALTEDCGPDGGAFVPMASPDFSALLRAAEGENAAMAQVLNHLFAAHLNAGDIRLACGKRPVRIREADRKIVSVGASCVRGNSVNSLAALVQQYLLRPEKVGRPSQWTQIAVQIAILAAAMKVRLPEGNGKPLDIAVVSGDLLGFMAAWYARSWGLPIGNIVICCADNSSMWDLLVQGQFRTDAVARRTALPGTDVPVPIGLERLVCACGGTGEVQRYLDICRRGGVYRPDEGVLNAMRSGVYVSVVSQNRMAHALYPGMDGYGILACCGVQDYRARTGATGICLILEET